MTVLQSSTDRLALVRANIARAARDVVRTPEAVTLVAVSKTFDADAIVPVLEAGQRVFGENRVQEAKAQVAGAARASIPGSNCT